MDTAIANRHVLEHHRRIAAIDQVALLLNWDQETQMPPKGGPQRAVQAGVVAAAAHALAADPRLAEWIGAAAERGRRLTAPRCHGRLTPRRFCRSSLDTTGARLSPAVGAPAPPEDRRGRPEGF